MLFKTLAAALVPALLCGCGMHRVGGQNSAPDPSAPVWASPARLAGQLGPEQQIGGYGIRPPAGYTLESLSLNAPDGSGSRCIWTGPMGAGGVTPYLQIDVGADDGGASSRVSSDDGVRIGLGAAAQNHSGMVYSALEHGTVNGLSFSRGYWKGYGQKTGKRFHGLVYARIASPSVITILGRDDEPSYRESVPLLEAAALTLRKL